MPSRSAFLATSLVLLPGAAFGHPMHGEAAGLAVGFAHPIGGADHILAMVAVGLIAGLAGGVARWLLPLVFLGMMSAGAALAMAGIDLPFVEPAITVSIVAFLLAAACARSIPPAVVAGLVGAFAIFHGAAHGAEMPGTVSGLSYGLGFLAATALLHGVGIVTGLGLARFSPKPPAVAARNR